MTAKQRKGKLSRDGVHGLVLLGVAVLLLAVAAVAPLIWQAALNSQLSEARQFLAMLEAKVKTRPQSATLSPQAVDSAFITGATSGLAMAELQRVVVDSAEKNGMVIERTRPLPTDTRQGLASLRMEVNTSGSIEELRGYLHAIETGAPLIFINQVHIAPGPAVADGDTSDSLSVRLEIEAFAWLEKVS